MIRDDVMNEMSTKWRQFTEFTAILIEETYWYKVDRKHIGISLSGRKGGCEYINEKCVTSYDPKNHRAKVINELDFCSILGNSIECSNQFIGSGYCGTTDPEKQSQTEIDSSIDYFRGVEMKSGSYIDNCPTIQIYSNHNCIEGKKTEAGDINYYGGDSRCLVSDLSREQISETKIQQCFQTRCE